MGCTSSTPNMPPSLANSEKEHSLSEEGEEHEMEEMELSHGKGLESNGIKVLPTCDTVDEPGQVDSHSKSNTGSSPDLAKDSNVNGHVAASENVQSKTHGPDMNADDLQAEEKLSSLEEVVEKVVEMHENGELEIKPNETEETGVEKAQTKPQEHVDAQETHDGDKEEVKEEEQVEDPASPSQSQSSRATRWEALADIAAELPPSLAVDPVTGQIYALSKH